MRNITRNKCIYNSKKLINIKTDHSNYEVIAELIKTKIMLIIFLDAISQIISTIVANVQTMENH